MVELSRSRTILMAVNIACAYVVWGLLISLLPPFYPKEAAAKGATPSQYGFVFGIANLAAFLTAPIFARFGNKIGPKILYNTGAYVQAICGVAFGFLTYVKGADLFIGLSYLLRALGGISDVAAWGAVLSILMKLYPTRVAQIMSWTEMFFGLGYMLGPALGAFLYEAGGFKTPFWVVGGIGLVVATGMVFLIPNVRSDDAAIKTGRGKELGFREVAKSPSIWLPFLDNTICWFGNGLVTAMMEPHLAEVGATTSEVGTSFLIFGACFAIATPTAGFICDKVPYPSMVSVLGNFIMIITFIFIGPLPFIPIEPSLPLLRGFMAMGAFGYGMVMVSTFSRAQLATLRKGYDKDIDTYLMISGMWSTSFYFGNFLGPTIAGFMVQAYGFRNSTILYWVLYLIFGVVDVCELTYNVKNKITQRGSEYENI